MANVIQNYFAANGITPVSNCLVTGYEFLTDSAQEIQNTLEGFGIPSSSITTLNDDFWNRDDLFSAWSAASPMPGLASVNAHFEHWAAIPAAGWELFTNDDITGSNNFANQVAYSMGCHAGLNVPDSTVITGPVQALGGISGTVTIPDFPQAFAQQGAAAWVANTGFGYGETVTIADSEKLMLLLTEAFGQADSVAIGDALIQAKQLFVDDTGYGGFGVYEEKSLIEATLYGLPMHRVSIDSLAAQTTSQSDSAVLAAATQTPLPDLGGLKRIGVAVSLNPTQQPPTPRGTYYAEGGDTYEPVGLPIQPQTSVAVQPPAGYNVQGVLFIGGTYHSLVPGSTPTMDQIDPVIATRPFQVSFPEAHLSTPGWHQDILWSLPPGKPNQIKLVGGQYKVHGLDWRLYDTMVLETYYSNQPPSGVLDIRDVSHTAVGSVVNFSVEVDDRGSGGPGALRVLVTYNVATGSNTGSWVSADLVQDPNSPSLWTVSVPGIASGTQHFYQLLSDTGEVAVDTNRGEYYIVNGGDVFNPIGVDHTFTVRLEIDYGDGQGFREPPVGTTGFGLELTGEATITSQTCNFPPGPGTDANGECTVDISPTDPTAPGTASLKASWSGLIDVAGILVSADLTANQDSAIKEWWEGSISIFKNTPANPNICFTLSRTDGNLLTTSPNPQCVPADLVGGTHLFRWEGLIPGTYDLNETVPEGIAPQISFTDIIVDDANRDWLLRTVNNGAAQGCTPGYWKNHVELWGVAPSTLFKDVFGVALPKYSETLTLEEAINLGGGRWDKLARHGVAAYLSADFGLVDNTRLNYLFSAEDVISMMSNSILTNKPEPTATEFADANEAPCPLN
jgi:hypothetical protein